MRRKLIIEQLSASYKDADNQKIIFTNLNFSAESGQALALFGSNGCGKSTLLRVISGSKTEDSGRISALGFNREWCNELTIIPQDYRASFFKWTNLENNIRLTFPHPVRDKKSILESIYEIKDRLSIDLDLKLRPQDCSGGMLQQAAIIRALARKPKILLGDEPFSALDVSIAAKLRKKLTLLVKEQEIICILVLHDLEDIVEVSDKVFVIPGMPYTSQPSKAMHQVQIINNSNVGQVVNEASSGSFIEIARKLLTDRASVQAGVVDESVAEMAER